MKLRTAAACIMISFAVAGCSRLQPIHNITNAPVLTSSYNTLTTDQVKQSIMMGAAAKGWSIKEVEPGKMEAKINVRGRHIAIVDILYNNKNYSIKYNNSANILHDGDMIHKKYNNWVIYLDRAIQKEMLGMAPSST